MLRAMRDLRPLIELLRIRTTNEKKLRFHGKKRLKVEPKKTEVIELWNSPRICVWHNDVRNDFCVYNNVLDPTAAYVYVTACGDALTSTMVVSFDWDVKEYHQPQLLDASLDDGQIADQLIEAVLNASGVMTLA